MKTREDMLSEACELYKIIGVMKIDGCSILDENSLVFLRARDKKHISWYRLLGDNVGPMMFCGQL